MLLHRYLLRYTTHRCLQVMMDQNEPFGAADLEEMARKHEVLFEKEVRAFTAADAVSQLGVSEGFGGKQLPFVFTIEALPDASAPLNAEEALCACGKVATQWRKDTPVCNDSECQRKAAQ